jgi:hypothetical protein
LNPDFKYDYLYVDGDSYTVEDHYVESKDSYWFRFKEYIGAENYVNFAHHGKPNTGMIRNAHRFYLQNRDKRVFYLLGFSHIERTEKMVDKQPWKQCKNPIEQFVHVVAFKDSKDYTVNYNREFEEVKFLNDSLLFYNFLESNNQDFIFHNCSKPYRADLDLPVSKDFWKEVLTCKKFPNLFDNTYHTVPESQGIASVEGGIGKQGHHGSAGNILYSRYLVSQYKELYEN